MLAARVLAGKSSGTMFCLGEQGGGRAGGLFLLLNTLTSISSNS